MPIEVIGELNNDAPIWRYLSLDKFIDLLHSQSLYFAPLSSFAKSDPFEGRLPPQVEQRLLNEALSEPNACIREIKKELDERLKQATAEEREHPDIKETLKTINAQNESLISSAKATFNAFLNFRAKATSVNCWHINHYESEAMWNLYSDSGKGIAIKSSIQKLIDSVAHSKEDITLSKVHYYSDSEFNNIELGNYKQPFKRKSFEHEKEIRLMVFNASRDWFENFLKKNNSISPNTAAELDSKIEKFQEAHKIKVDLGTLIEELYISPYVGEPFNTAVKSLINTYRGSVPSLQNLPNPVESKLLNPPSIY
ncbi:DUF2971 domain-containing protein [Pseudoalteromonas sp. PS5]|uniref:DUF2971 domain-containing protein n=1 Tax=Pseudoalteromonas sp. PS5 TaxID=1437473 RepID=UPI000FFE80BC|nr:DUF2971 domain-containing protein [Pseudoalteromonas sp. PS5]RXF00398.1 DUF2971 domain-containing protein [Pseudoalteromonas sp. PS5]